MHSCRGFINALGSAQQVSVANTASFRDAYIAIDGLVSELVDLFAWGRPMNLKLINFSSRANAQHFARIVGR